MFMVGNFGDIRWEMGSTANQVCLDTVKYQFPVL
jgi:hypothetical protein